MSTNTVTGPAGIRPTHMVRQGLVFAVLLATGVGLGMAIDTGQGVVPINAQAEPTAAEHGAFTAMTFRDPSVIQKRFGGSDADLDPDVATPEFDHLLCEHVENVSSRCDKKPKGARRRNRLCRDFLCVATAMLGT